LALARLLLYKKANNGKNEKNRKHKLQHFNKDKGGDTGEKGNLTKKQ
jgi:hypothetical protein